MKILRSNNSRRFKNSGTVSEYENYLKLVSAASMYDLESRVGYFPAILFKDKVILFDENFESAAEAEFDMGYISTDPIPMPNLELKDIIKKGISDETLVAVNTCIPTSTFSRSHADVMKGYQMEQDIYSAIESEVRTNNELRNVTARDGRGDRINIDDIPAQEYIPVWLIGENPVPDGDYIDYKIKELFKL